MSVRIDFTLSNRFSAVEQAIFRLVIDGVRDVNTITALLSVYSDEVIANAIKMLVNYQILRANIESRTLALSDTILALIDQCLEQSNTLTIEDFEFIGSLSTADNRFEEKEKYQIKHQLLSTLLPGVNIGFLVKSLEFTIYQRGDQDE